MLWGEFPLLSFVRFDQRILFRSFDQKTFSGFRSKSFVRRLLQNVLSVESIEKGKF
jgi:hypothetical protein